MRFERRMRTERLEPRCLLTTTPFISEFQAVNDATLQDSDGDFSDWIEIRNDGADEVSLGGWFLTDDADRPRKWRIPSTSIAGRSELVIFASSKDRIDPSGELHTNFKLSGGGEYLALVKPDGVVQQDFGPAYPQQTRDQSYGLATGQALSSLLPSHSPNRALVPEDGSLAETWQSLEFDDGSWTGGNAPVGYEQLPPASSISEEFGVVLSPVWSVDIPTAGAGEVTLEDGRLKITAPEEQTLGADPSRGLAPLVYRSIPDDVASFELITHVETGKSRANAGIIVYDAAVDEPFLRLEYQMARQFAFVGSNEIDLGTARKSNRSSYFLRLSFDHLQRVWSAYYRVDTTDDWTLVGSVREGERGLGTPVEPRVGMHLSTTSQPGTALFDSFTIEVLAKETFKSRIDRDIESDMAGRNSSVYMRFPFNVEGDVSKIQGLRLTAAYDDGFKAFLNGREIAARNAPADSSWNSAAIVPHGVIHGSTPAETIDVTAHLDALQAGTNILAVHGMNVGVADRDFFFDARLTASQTLSINEQVFVTPTPGQPNLSPTVSAPEVVSEQGVFFGSHIISLRNTAGPETEIRYTLDGDLPTRTSPRYEGPIEVSKSTMFQARTFDVSAENLEPSATVSGTFIAMAENIAGKSSDLPLLVMDTIGRDIPETEATTLTPVNVILYDVESDTGEASLGDGLVDYFGRGGVRVRGSTTRGQVKPNLSFETWGLAGFKEDQDEDASLIGLPTESDWVLHAPFSMDRALIRNQVFHELASSVLEWAPRTKPVEVYLNREDGVITEDDYAGLYVLMEKVKRGPDRVNVSEITPSASDPNDPSITGGYVWKVDRADPGEPPFSAGGHSLNWVYPKSPGGRGRIDQQATLQQQTWVQEHFDQFAATLQEPNLHDPDGYSKFIDVDSWIDSHLVNVLTFNVDAFRLSTFLYKDREGKIEYGPPWDCDRCMDSADDRDDDPTVWSNPGGTDFFTSGPHHDPWFRELFKDPGFWQQYIDRWSQLRRTLWSADGLDAMIDAHAANIATASLRDAERWSRSFRSSSGFDSGKLDETWEGEIEHLRSWIHARAEFMDSNFVDRPVFKLEDRTLADVTEVEIITGTQIEVSPADIEIVEDATSLTGDPDSTSATYFVPSDDSLGGDWTAIGFDDSSWGSGLFGLGFARRDNFTDLIQTEVDARELAPGSTTILTRIPFQIDDLESLLNRSLVLRIKFDDGFVAYLNGEEIASRNLRDENLAWDSRANSRPDDASREYLEFDVSQFKHLLAEGDNVLAIRGINSSATNGDMLLVPELQSRLIRSVPLPTSQVYVTTDGMDPRGADGKPSPSALQLVPGQELAITEDTSVFARVFDPSDRGPEASIVGTDWSAPTIYRFVVQPPSLAGDFDVNGVIDAADIDLLFAELRKEIPSRSFDLTGDGVVDEQDRDRMIKEILQTNYGDIDLDGQFSSADVTAAFEGGEYEDEEDSNSTWAEGDWNGDGDFTSTDLVLAFRSGAFVGVRGR